MAELGLLPTTDRYQLSWSCTPYCLSPDTNTPSVFPGQNKTEKLHDHRLKPRGVRTNTLPTTRLLKRHTATSFFPTTRLLIVKTPLAQQAGSTHLRLLRDELRVFPRAPEAHTPLRVPGDHLQSGDNRKARRFMRR